MPPSPTPPALSALTAALAADPGLIDHLRPRDLRDGLAAAAELNRILLLMIETTGVNDDGLISPADMQAISDAIWLPENAQGWREFWLAHGNDSGTAETGYHLLQNDGGTLLFRGRNFVDTVADGIYHFGFQIRDGHYYNEDGNDNEAIADVAGWLNWFLNGRSVVWGGAGHDALGSGRYDGPLAAARHETFFGGAGNDSLWSDRGDDILFGEDGDDQAAGGIGNDSLDGGAGHDALWGEAGEDTLAGGAGNDGLGGGTEADALAGGAGNDTLSGEDGNDLLAGDDGDDRLYGGNDRDRMAGGQGHDLLDGGRQADVLTGDDGNDTLNGSEGADHLTGGTGADLFQMWEKRATADVLHFAPGDSGITRATIDRVEGFQTGTDKIDLRAFGPLVRADLDFIGEGQGSFLYDGRHLRIDSDGDRRVDMIIGFSWIEDLPDSDFLLA